MSIFPPEPEPNVPAGYDPQTGVIAEAPWYDPNRAKKPTSPYADVLGSLIGALVKGAKPRPDIVTPGSTGKLENARPYTFAGRVGSASTPETPEQMMQRPAVGDAEGGGVGLFDALPEALKQFLPQMSASLMPKLLGAGMAKSFRPASGQPGGASAARLARPNSIPRTPYERMYPALVDERTGEVIHAVRPTGPGGHKALYEQAAHVKGFTPTRAFLDPQTFDVYTEAMLEQIAAQRARGGVSAYR